MKKWCIDMGNAVGGQMLEKMAKVKILLNESGEYQDVKVIGFPKDFKLEVEVVEVCDDNWYIEDK